MTRKRSQIRSCKGERGQTLAMVVLILGIALLGIVAFSVDYSNVYFHRQNAQNAADAACTAGIMDLLANSQGNSLGNFPVNSPPTTFQCSANSTAAPCQYAALNGYSASGLTPNTPSSEVEVSFPSSLSGVTPPPESLAPNPFLQVKVTDRVPTWFAGLISGSRTVDVGARAVCALQQAHAPVPIIVLNPTCTQAFDVSGSATVAIVGGPSRSIQVNSDDQTCAATTQSGNGCSGSGTIDLSQGGPNFNGGSFGVFGTPTAAPSGFNGGTKGSWSPGAAPIGDPYALVNAPGQPTTAAPAPIQVPYGVDGCPDQTQKCREYFPGLYTSAITVKGETAIFRPGVYYVTGTKNDNCGSPSQCNTKPTGQCRYGLDVDANGVVRPANDPTTGYGSGAMFYLSGASGPGSYGSVFFGSSAGNYGGRKVDDFTTLNFTCPSGAPPPSQLNIPSTVSGNVLMGQCTTGGTWVGSTTTTSQTDTAGTIRGLIFFQDRANADVKGQASMQGGGGLVISGNMYFHNCNSTGTGTGCSNPTSGYNAFFQLQGTPGSGTYVLGNVTADSFVLSGNGAVSMSLNPNAVYNILKASLIQ